VSVALVGWTGAAPYILVFFAPLSFFQKKVGKIFFNKVT